MISPWKGKIIGGWGRGGKPPPPAPFSILIGMGRNEGKDNRAMFPESRYLKLELFLLSISSTNLNKIWI